MSTCMLTQGRGWSSRRSGELQGTCAFTCEDTVGPFGHAAYAGIRHGQRHAFRLIARGDFFEFYVDDLYVQTFTLADSLHRSGRPVGLRWTVPV